MTNSYRNIINYSYTFYLVGIQQRGTDKNMLAWEITTFLTQVANNKDETTGNQIICHVYFSVNNMGTWLAHKLNHFYVGRLVYTTRILSLVYYGIEQ